MSCELPNPEKFSSPFLINLLGGLKGGSSHVGKNQARNPKDRPKGPKPAKKAQCGIEPREPDIGFYFWVVAFLNHLWLELYS